jgi:hypothetical protein
MGWLDVIVAVALGIFGIYLIGVLIVDGGSALDVAVLVVFAGGLVRLGAIQLDVGDAQRLLEATLTPIGSPHD